MTDVFDATILCKNCGIKMKPTIVNREGFELRAVECSKCKDKIIHPADMNGFQHFNDMKGKTFNVKLRMVGNSHAVSIPKEIIDFMNETHREMKRNMDDMVRLCFEDFDKLSLRFGDEDDFDDKNELNEHEKEFESDRNKHSQSSNSQERIKRRRIF
jgi:hypothetical protein